DDWKQAIKVLGDVVKDWSAEEVKQLRHIIPYLSAHTKLVEAENRGLHTIITALKPSNKKREKLDLQ
ncbi:hypothetical protein BU25DRAFT_482495, partial [Macroventuria anomochaeta]